MLKLHPQTLNSSCEETPKNRVHVRVASALATSLLMLVALVPTAQAVYVEFGSAGAPTTNQTVDIEMDGHSISIIDETRVVSVNSNEYGLRLRYNVHLKTIRFNSGPVMLSSVEFDGPGGQAMIDGPDGATRVLAGATVGRYVTSVQTVGFYTASVGNTAGATVGGGVNVDLGRPVSAIPEPNAAMLFAAGMGFVAVTARRKR